MLLASYTLWRREIVRFYRQRSRIVGALGSPLVFWFLIGSGLGRSFQGGAVAAAARRLPGVLLPWHAGADRPLHGHLLHHLDRRGSAGGLPAGRAGGAGAAVGHRVREDPGQHDVGRRTGAAVPRARAAGPRADPPRRSPGDLRRAGAGGVRAVGDGLPGGVVAQLDAGLPRHHEHLPDPAVDPVWRAVSRAAARLAGFAR